MNIKSRRFKAVDVLLILLTVLPLVAGMVIKALTTPLSNGIEITGAQIYFTVPMPIQDWPITAAQINSVLVIISVLGLCLYFTHGLSEKAQTKRQLIAEWIVEATQKMTLESMGEFFRGFAPFIAAMLALSAFSSLLTLIGLYPPTSDLNIIAGWAILVFILITYYKLKGGLLNYLKGFLEPIFIMLPMNILSELATPLAMAFRHYGNVMSGSVIAVLISFALANLSNAVLGWLPGILGSVPFLQIGLPAILSLYFDIFSGCMQAYIFAMLTMLNVSMGFPQDEYEKRKLKKLNKKQINN